MGHQSCKEEGSCQHTAPDRQGDPGTRSHTWVTGGANDRLIPRVSRHACSAQKSLYLGQKEERPRRKRLLGPLTVPAIHPQVCGQRKGLPETAALLSRQTVVSLLLLKTFLFASKSVSPSCLENSAAELDTAFTGHPGRYDHAAFVRWVLCEATFSVHLLLRGYLSQQHVRSVCSRFRQGPWCQEP